MKAIIKFRNENREDKVIRFFNSEKLVDLLCETRFGKGLASILYKCGIDCIIFD